MNEKTAKALLAFAQMLAAMETEEEINARTDNEGMSGDDACETLSAAIGVARKLVKAAANGN